LWDHPVGRLRPAWLDGLDPARPILYVTQGTAVGPMREEFFTLVMEAFENEPVQVIMTTGDAVDHARLGRKPDNVILEHFVPQSYFLDRVSVMLHHGGFSTCLGGLKYGVPMVMVPFNWDQPDNARRVQELGAGIMLRPAFVTRGRLRRYVRRVLEDAQYRERARRISEKMKGTASAEKAAQLLLQLGETGKPVFRT